MRCFCSVPSRSPGPNSLAESKVASAGMVGSSELFLCPSESFVSKNHSFESTQGWCSKTVSRQVPLAMVLLTLVKAWYARCAVDEPSLLPKTMPWYEHKRHPSFVNMLSALRKVLWQHRISPNLRFSQRVKELIEAVKPFPMAFLLHRKWLNCSNGTVVP